MALCYCSGRRARVIFRSFDRIMNINQLKYVLTVADKLMPIITAVIYLGFAMKLIKHQSTDADEVIMKEGNRKVSTDTAYFLNAAIKLGLEFEEEEGGVIMCKAIENKEKRDKVTGAIQGMRLVGASDEDIITKIVNHFGVSKEYVLALLTPKKA